LISAPSHIMTSRVGIASLRHFNVAACGKVRRSDAVADFGSSSAHLLKHRNLFHCFRSIFLSMLRM
jgi:hypothetical protein